MQEKGSSSDVAALLYDADSKEHVATYGTSSQDETFLKDYDAS